MFGSLGNVLGAAKDRAAEAGAKAYLSRKIEKFGRVTRLEIDSRNKTAAAEVRLDGEVSPVTVEVGKYEILQREGESYIVLSQMSSSRPWLSVALNEFLAGQPLKLPAAAASVL